MAETTVRELIERLEELAETYGDGTPVRIAEQPSYPLQNYIDDDIRPWQGVLYLKCGNQVGGYSYDDDTTPNNSPYLPKHIFGDPPEEACGNCESLDVVGTVLLGSGQDRESVCENCLVMEVPTEVAESYRGDLPLSRVMDLRTRANTTV